MSAVWLLAILVGEPEPVTMQGIGSLRIGLPVAALRERFGATLAEGQDPDDHCTYWTSSPHPELGLMVVGGRLVRIDIDTAAYRTRSGVRIGMSEREIRGIYGARMRVEVHPYTHPDGKYLVYQARGEPYGLIIETDHGRAVSMRVGYWESVQWIEGCS
jgi:hypothetical protein